jgi:hypothetical protein
MIGCVVRAAKWASGALAAADEAVAAMMFKERRDSCEGAEAVKRRRRSVVTGPR